ncbi:MAG: WD40 repeat domain-containing protein [Pelagimonas sp.]|nr:WD40 repeat domain-containing protein [Pelagimonas sp.]
MRFPNFPKPVWLTLTALVFAQILAAPTARAQGPDIHYPLYTDDSFQTKYTQGTDSASGLWFQVGDLTVFAELRDLFDGATKPVRGVSLVDTTGRPLEVRVDHDIRYIAWLLHLHATFLVKGHDQPEPDHLLVLQNRAQKVLAPQTPWPASFSMADLMAAFALARPSDAPEPITKDQIATQSAPGSSSDVARYLVQALIPVLAQHREELVQRSAKIGGDSKETPVSLRDQTVRLQRAVLINQLMLPALEHLEGHATSEAFWAGLTASLAQHRAQVRLGITDQGPEFPAFFDEIFVIRPYKLGEIRNAVANKRAQAYRDAQSAEKPPADQPATPPQADEGDWWEATFTLDRPGARRVPKVQPDQAFGRVMPAQIPLEGGRYRSVVWSPDGQSLFLTRDDGMLVERRLDSQKTTVHGALLVPESDIPFVLPKTTTVDFLGNPLPDQGPKGTSGAIQHHASHLTEISPVGGVFLARGKGFVSAWRPAARGPKLMAVLTKAKMSRGGAALLGYGAGQPTRILELESGQTRRDDLPAAEFADWSPDDQVIMLQTPAGALLRINAATGEQHELMGNAPPIQSAVWSPDGHRLLAIPKDAPPVLVDLRAGIVRPSPALDMAGKRVIGVGWSHKGGYLKVIKRGGETTVLRSDGGAAIDTFREQERKTGIWRDPRGLMQLTTDDFQSAFDRDKGYLVFRPNMMPEPFRDYWFAKRISTSHLHQLAWHPGGDAVAALDRDQSLHIVPRPRVTCDTAKPDPRRHCNPLRAVSFGTVDFNAKSITNARLSKDGQSLAALTGRPAAIRTKSLAMPNDPVRDVGPANHKGASFLSDLLLSEGDPTTGGGRLIAVIETAKGSAVVNWTRDGTPKTAQLFTGRAKRGLHLHPDGQTLVVVGAEETRQGIRIRIEKLDLTTGQVNRLDPIKVRDRAELKSTLSADGQRLLVTRAGKTSFLVDLASGQHRTLPLSRVHGFGFGAASDKILYLGENRLSAIAGIDPRGGRGGEQGHVDFILQGIGTFEQVFRDPVTGNVFLADRGGGVLVLEPGAARPRPLERCESCRGQRLVAHGRSRSGMRLVFDAGKGRLSIEELRE